MADAPNNYPKLHNAAWPGIVGKGAPDSEAIIALDTLLELTARAALRNAESSTGARSGGTRTPCRRRRMYGNSKRTTRWPSATRPSAASTPPRITHNLPKVTSCF